MNKYKNPSITTDLNGNFKEQPKAKSKTKPKEYIESAWITEYRMESRICTYIMKGGECHWSNEQVQNVKEKYFKNYQNKLL